MKITKTVVLGITDAITDCSCCGKANLKYTVAIEIVETGEIVFYGSVCATKAEKYANDFQREKVRQEISIVKANRNNTFYIANNGDRISKMNNAVNKFKDA